MADWTLSNYFIALKALATRYGQLKPRHPNFVLFFRLGVFYQTFGEDAEVLSQVAGVPLRVQADGLPVAEIPVLDCETVINRVVRRGHRVMILDDGPSWLSAPRDSHADSS